MKSPIPAGHANIPGNKRNIMRTRNIAPMIRHACMAVKRPRSRLSERARTYADKEYAMTNKIGGAITETSKARGGLSGGVANTPRTFRIIESAAHAAITNQTGNVLVAVPLI